MKKVVTAFMIVISIGLLFVSSSLSEPQSLPAPNTNAEILFNDFDWYADYPTTKAHAESLGWYSGWDFFYDDLCVTPHWTYLESKVNNGSELKCGGSFPSVNNLPQVAGYPLKDINYYFMWDINSGMYENYVDKAYRTNGSTQLYMAVYSFDVADYDACYQDLVKKLKKKYGDNPYQSESNISNPYTYWVNHEGAMVGVSIYGKNVMVVYSAPGAEEKLCAVEEAVKKKQIDDAGDDMSGL